MTVKEMISVFQFREKDVLLGIGDNQTVLLGEEDTRLLDAFGTIVVGRFYIEDNQLHIEPKEISTIVRDEKPSKLEVLK